MMTVDVMEERLTMRPWVLRSSGRSRWVRSIGPNRCTYCFGGFVGGSGWYVL